MLLKTLLTIGTLGAFTSVGIAWSVLRVEYPTFLLITSDVDFRHRLPSLRKSCRQTGITRTPSPSSALVRRSPLWSGSSPEVIIPSDHAH
jgi:hypothetical protein